MRLARAFPFRLIALLVGGFCLIRLAGHGHDAEALIAAFALVALL